MTDPVVELDSGRIRGLVEKHEDGFSYYSFKGIPYAEPPVGDLRFEDPIAIKKWTGTLDCTNYGPLCFQTDILSGASSLDENCLHLNVFTHTINNPNERKAVIVWAHLGNFTYGNASDMYSGPDHIIRKDVVLVTINFRLGILGFLNLEDPIAPGNQGLKDQIMALQWVQKNIQQFGGNPDNITFGGATAGGASAHYLALSPLAKGLMHKLICHSGVVYVPWSTVKTPKKNAIAICSLLGKNLQDPKEIKDFLRKVDTITLNGAISSFWRDSNIKPFGPGPDDKSPNPVLPIDRFKAADEGTHLPCLVGYNSRPGLLALLDSLSFKTMTKKQFFEMGNQDFQKIIHYNAKDVLDRYNLSASQVRRFYYKSEAVHENNTANYVDYCGHVHFQVPIHRFVRVQANRSSAPTYMYMFNFDVPNEFKISHMLGNGLPKEGSVHDELPFLFKMGFLEKFGYKNVSKGTKNYRILEQMTEMWTNFAKHGRPTIELSELIPVHWKPISNGTLFHYMNIDEDLTMQCTVNLEEKWFSAKQIKV